MGLQPSEILIIDGMLITGLLILTTIGTTSNIDSPYNPFLAIGTLMIIPFAISAYLELDKMIEKWNWKDSKAWMLGGFVFLAVIMAIFVTGEIFKLNIFNFFRH